MNKQFNNSLEADAHDWDTRKTCACIADDASMCFQLRYPEVTEEDGHQEQCMCPCHGELQEDSDE